MKRKWNTLQFEGRIHVISNKNGVKYISVDCRGIAEYYRWHIWKATGKFLNTPMRGGHVTIYNSRVHSFRPYSKLARAWNGRKIKFFADVVGVVNGRSRKGFENYIFKVWGKELHKVIRELGLSSAHRKHKPHLVICNSKGDVAKNPHSVHWKSIVENS